MKQRARQKSKTRRGRYVGGVWESDATIEDDHSKLIGEQCDKEAKTKAVDDDLRKWMFSPTIGERMRQIAMLAYGDQRAKTTLREVWCSDPEVMLTTIEAILTCHKTQD